MARPVNPTKAALDGELALLKMDIFPLIEVSITEQELWLSNVQLRHALECVRSAWAGIIAEGFGNDIEEIVNNVLETGECYPDD